MTYDGTIIYPSEYIGVTRTVSSKRKPSIFAFRDRNIQTLSINVNCGH